MFRLLFVISLCFSAIYSANILGLMGVASPSHFQWNHALMSALANSGHNVTVLSADIPKSNHIVPANLHYIHLDNLYKFIYEKDDFATNLDITEFIGSSGLSSVTMYYHFCLEAMGGIHTSKGFHHLLNYPETFKFDVIVNDYTIGNPLLGFVHRFKNPPLIGVTTFLNPPMTEDLIGNHMFPAYTPHWSTEWDVDMTFPQRVENFLIYNWETMYLLFILIF